MTRPRPEAGPPVIVLGIGTPIGLAIIRELGEHGLVVHGVGDADAIGRHSRHLAEAHVRQPGEAVIAQLAALGMRLGPGCRLMCVSEGDIALLNRHRDALTGLDLLIPQAQAMERVVNKDQANRYAAEAGLELPRSWTFRSLAELDVALPGIGFPVVLKWPNPNSDAKRLGALGLACEKSRYCHDEAELRSVLAPYLEAGECPLVQEYVRGIGLGQFVFMHRGRALLRFQHRRVREWPPEGGFACVCEGVAFDQHAALFERSIDLLRRMGWEGAAMVEYRWDAASDKAVFMEVNGRFWGSLPLAYHSGAPFAWLTAAVGRGEIDRLPAPRTDLRCRFIIPELKRLVRIVARPQLVQDRTLRFSRLGEIAAFLYDFLRPRTRYYVFSSRDMSPFFADVWNVVRGSMRVQVRR
jgi:predicted ATP-grasp superfamily ATP-dependent carboligase